MCEVTSWQAAALAGWAILEFWLGTTKLVEAGSTLELVLNFLKKVVGALDK